MLLNFEHLKTFYSALKQKMKNFRGNWDQNDPTADDYIKNRPFYSEGGNNVEILPRTTVSNDFAVGLNFPLTIGQEYKIIFDNIEYTSVARFYDGYVMIGNNAIYDYDNGIETDTGEPFAAKTNEGSSELYFYINDDESHTIQILESKETIHKLDKKYLPDNIITTDKLDVINDYVENAISGVEDAIYEDRARLDVLEAIDHDAYIEADKDVIEKLAWGSFNKNGIVKVAGLYETGTDTMIKSWRKLLTEGVVHVDNGVVSTNYSYNEGINYSREALTGDLVLPNSVTSIGDSAFYNCTSLTSVTISDSVTLIGSYAFYGCSSLTSVEIGDGVTSIGGSAFKNCSSLTSIVIPDSVTSIGSSAFNGCGGLTEITLPFIGEKSGLTENDTYQYPLGYIFGTSSYAGGNKITQKYYGASTSGTTSSNYYIPSLKSVTVTGGNIPNGAFYGCQIDKVILGDKVLIGKYAFNGGSGLKSIEIANGIPYIGKYAFYSCTGLTSIEIPNSVTSIGDDAFYNCTGLTSIVIPDSVTSIGSYAFELCGNLTEITLSNNITSISEHMFMYCDSLESITIPNSVTSIDEGAFLDCTSLRDMTIGAGVVSIGEEAFYRCYVRNIQYAGTKAQWKSIVFGTNWNRDTADYIVTCTDGTIAKDGTET